MLDFFSDMFEFIRSRREMRRKGVLAPKHNIRKEDIGELFDRSPAAGIFILIMIWMSCAVLLTLSGHQHLSDSRYLVEGQIAPRNLTAAFDFTAPDYAKLEQEEKKVQRELADFFEISSARNGEIRAKFQIFLRGDRSYANLFPDLAEHLKKHPLASSTDFLQKLDQELQRGILSKIEKSSRLTGKNITVIDTRNRRKAPRPVMEIPNSQQAAVKLAAEYNKALAADAMPPSMQNDLAKLFEQFIGIQGNLVFDRDVTRQEMQTKLKNLSDATIQIAKGDLLVRRGEKITPALSKLLAEYAKQENERFLLDDEITFFLQNMFWAFILVTFASFYLYHLHPELVCSNKRLCLVALVMIGALTVNYGILRSFNFLTSTLSYIPPDFVLNLVPFALASVVLAVIFGFRVALAAGFFIASVTALMLIPEKAFAEAMKGVAICSLSALAVRSATNYRSYFVRIVSSVFPLTLLLNIALLHNREGWNLHIAGSYAVMALGGAIITGIIALLLIFCCELVFNVSTNMALMVLCDYNHPLLERLKREAPGTFFHSLMVATLVEDAARVIGANPLKAKAGALFHDIGKLAMPLYFTENNAESGNQHLKLNPQMSSIIIRDHVKEGLVLARQYHLCRTVRDAIAQHHGNDLVHYFYRRAVEESKFDGSQVLESQFRYNGQPPHEKELVILSLADACEAASRSLDKPSAVNIENLVNNIVMKRYQDGQLQNADLSLSELDRIRISFINTLVSMKHGRVAYEQKGENDDQLELFVGEQTVSPTEEK
ncbi:MAG: HDIG domain-containing protein [Lentisphaeria bacterium]|nr:HDIG domain-containing protein [Lentisphaeria bacterium]